MLQVPLSAAIEAGLAGYALLGSASLGYILLRSGWPGLRTISLEYKSGMSIVSGAVLSAGIIGLSYLPRIVSPVGLLLSPVEFMFINTSVASVSGAAIFTAKRHLSAGRKKLKISVPKRAVSASIVSKLAMEKMPQGSYVKAPDISQTPGGAIAAWAAATASASGAGHAMASQERPYSGAQFHEASDFGMNVVVSGREKKPAKGNAAAEQYTNRPTPENARSEQRVNELKDRLISLGEKPQAARQMPVSPEVNARQSPAKAEQAKPGPGRPVVFEPTREIIEKVVEKQKSASAQRTIGRPGQEARKGKELAAKAGAMMKGAGPIGVKTGAENMAAGLQTLPGQNPATAKPQTQKIAGAPDGKIGIFDRIFGAKKAGMPKAAGQPDALAGKSAAAPNAPMPPVSRLLPATITGPQAQKPKQQATGAQTAPMPRLKQVISQVQKSAAPKPGSGTAGTLSGWNAEQEEKDAFSGPEAYISVRPQGAEKIAGLRKKLEQFGIDRPLGEALPQAEIERKKSALLALRGARLEIPQSGQAKPAQGNEKSMEEIFARLERQKAQRSAVVTTREQAKGEADDSASFIRRELRERLGLQPQSQKPAQAAQQGSEENSMPKSARLLKELLREG